MWELQNLTLFFTGAGGGEYKECLIEHFKNSPLKVCYFLNRKSKEAKAGSS